VHFCKAEAIIRRDILYDSLTVCGVYSGAEMMDDKDSPLPGDRQEENEKTREKMQLVRSQMENMSLLKEHKSKVLYISCCIILGMIIALQVSSYVGLPGVLLPVISIVLYVARTLHSLSLILSFVMAILSSN